MNKLAAKLHIIVIFFNDSLSWVQEHCIIFALIAGLLLPFFIMMPKNEKRDAPFWLKSLAALSFFSFLFGTIAPASFYLLSLYFYGATGADVFDWVVWAMVLTSTLLGVLFCLIAMRLLAPEIEAVKQKVRKKTALERDVRTDVRNVRDLLPKTMKYNPLDYIDLDKGLFIGLNENEEPQYIPIEDWQKQHADLIGTTGAGKGVAAAILLYQSILAGEGVFVLDPKNDEWAPHLYREACRMAGKPYAYIDLAKKQYQLDLLDGIDEDDLEELLNAGFSLGKKGDVADFYRLGDRQASRSVSQQFKPGMTLRDLYNCDFVSGLKDTVPNFHGELEEVSILNSINASGGLKLKDTFDTGGCVYIVGSMRSPKIISAQRMILIKLIQIAEKRDRIFSKPRPIAIFLDELKYHISKAAMEGLGAARDKGVHMILAHQSLADLEDCPADLKPNAVIGAVVENTKFKLVYKLQDPKTAKWVAEMTGSILVDDESRQAKTDSMMVERIEGTRTIRQAERYYIDTNMLQNLPDGVSFIFTSKSLARASMIAPILVEKKELVIYESQCAEQSEIKQVIAFAPYEGSMPVIQVNEDNSEFTPVESVEHKPAPSTIEDDFSVFNHHQHDQGFGEFKE
ncbi:type IV secretory system conjugative DNA transfer family protein [Pantoea ananatis]|uniref:type IV secretory system conjugative DNA transfer family protein n=1 Tax=Pantoea ananas TaxID=553 RepID=UPI001B3068B9|nr:type IV secretion system DNA-binding domain-containing protein [Pantoea ananatis]